MPIIKSAKKRVLQTAKKQKRNYAVRVVLKRAIKDLLEATKAGKKDEAEKLLPNAYKVIDTAAKKKILNRKTANRRKAMLAKAIANVGKAKAEVVAKKTTAPKAKKVAVKAVAKPKKVSKKK